MVTIEDNKAFSTEGLGIRRKGSAGRGYSSMTPASDPDRFEEVDPSEREAEAGAAETARFEEARKARVAALIRERYSPDDEFALINNMIDSPTEEHRDEYAAYQAYRAECKERAKAERVNPEFSSTNE